MITYSNGRSAPSAEICNYALTEACSTAEQALNIAEGIDEHFWSDNTGAHITKKTQDEYIVDPANGGGNTLITSEGMAVRNGQTELATFGSDGAQIGKNNESKVRIDYRSMRLIDKNGNAYFIVKEMLDENENVEETFSGDGITTQFYTRTEFTGYYQERTVAQAGALVYVDGVQVVSPDVQTILSGAGPRYKGVEFANAPAVGAAISVRYYDMYVPQNYKQYKCYILGIGKQNANSGLLSVVEGLDCEATGNCAHAEGREASADGYCSHAQNIRTKVIRAAQTAIGLNNEIDTEYGLREISSGIFAECGKYALIIGNGTDDNARSNALTVDWSGNLEAAGDITDGGGNVLSNKLDTSTLADYVIEQDSDGDWRYRKWHSGRVEAWFNTSVTMSATTAQGNLYRRSATLSIPSGIFTITPGVIAGSQQSDNTIVSVKASASSPTSIAITDYRTNQNSSTQARAVRIYAWQNPTS